MRQKSNVKEGLTIIQLSRIDRNHDSFLAHGRGNNSRAVTLAASQFQNPGAGRNVPVLQDCQAMNGLRVLDVEVFGIV